jgi:Tfp pilus assembly protein PilO
LHDFVVSQAKDAKSKDSKRKGPLIMEATAKTYRYLDEDEIAKEAAKRKELEKGAKKKKK